MKAKTFTLIFTLLFLLLSNVAKAEDVTVNLNANNLASDEALKSVIDLTGKSDVNLVFSLEEGTTSLTDEQISRISQFVKNNWQTVTGIDLSSIESIKTLPNGTFQGADKLTSIKLPALTSLSSNLFTNCSSLNSLTIGEWSNEEEKVLEMEKIPAGCFQSCANLNHVYIEGVSKVEGWAFSGCTSMTKFPIQNFKEGAKVEVGSNAFENMKLSGELTLPEGITSIAGNCFGSCLELTSITFPSTVTTIDVTFDTNCTALTHIKVADGNTTYEAIKGILYKRDNGNLTLVRCPIANPEPIQIPSDKNITEIANQAFNGCLMKEITLNSNLKKIGENAFNNCTNLTSLTIPASVNDIATSFVNGCTSLATLMVEAGNTVYQTINKITYAKVIVKENGETKETKAVFRVPQAFEIENDGKLELPSEEGVTRIGTNAFEGVKKLKELSLPDNITTMADECFKGSGLETFHVPQHLTEEGFGLAPFSECSSLSKFAGENLDHFYVDDKGILYNKAQDKLFKVPNNYQPTADDGKFIIRHNIKEVQGCAFEGVSQIKEVDFAQGIKEVPHRCFYNAKSITKVLIPNSVTVIGQDAFMGSTVENVYMLTTTTKNAPKSQNGNFNSFYGVVGNFKIHLSDNSEYDNIIDNWANASNEFKSTATREADRQKEEQDSKDYGWYGLKQNNRLTEDIMHRALFENSENIAGFNGENENSVLNEKDEHNTLSATHYDYITLYRDFSGMKEDEYATLALPIDVTKATLVNAFGENTKIWEFTGRKDGTLNFNTVDIAAAADDEIIIKKGVAVLIRPEYKENSYLLQMNLGGENNDANAIALTESDETSYGKLEDQDLVKTTGNLNYVNGEKQDNVDFKYGFYATYQKKSFMEKGSYYMLSNGSFKYAVNRLWTKAFRGFIHGNDNAINGDANAPAKLSFDGFTTSIDEINIEGNDHQSYDIYNVNGQLVRKNATSTEGLSKGMYIMNGKKVIIK